MPREIEIKYRLGDPGAMEERLRSAGGVFCGRVLERNTLYDFPDRRLARADRALRLRVAIPTDARGSALAGRPPLNTWTFKGPRVRGVLKNREEWESALQDPGAAEQILLGLGLEPALRFEKRRASYRFEAAEVVLDELPGLGHFLEIEASQERIAELRERLGIDREDCDARIEERSYPALVQELLERDGERELRFPEN